MLVWLVVVFYLIGIGGVERVNFFVVIQFKVYVIIFYDLLYVVFEVVFVFKVVVIVQFQVVYVEVYLLLLFGNRGDWGEFRLFFLYLILKDCSLWVGFLFVSVVEVVVQQVVGNVLQLLQ